MKQLIITVALMVFFAGCNNGQTNKNQEKKMKKLNSLEWAEAVYAIYDDCITELDGLVGEKPEPDAALKEKDESVGDFQVVAAGSHAGRDARKRSEIGLGPAGF
jgi:hypothetical protein